MTTISMMVYTVLLFIGGTTLIAYSEHTQRLPMMQEIEVFINDIHR